MELNIEKGFTLLELLFVITLVGILASIAIPQYTEYRARAYNLRAQVDLRNVAIAEEVYFMEYERYLGCQNQSCEALPGIVRLSKGVLLTMQATASGFTGNAQHPQGTRNFQWDSSRGGMLE